MAIFTKKNQPQENQKVKKEELKIEKPKKISSVQKDISVTTVGTKKEIRSRMDKSFLVRPIITEKATEQQAQNRYIFEVDLKANKIMIKKAIKDLYRVNPLKVNIVRISGKNVRYGKSKGRTKNRKKAVVFLKPGDKITFLSEKANL